LTKTSLELAAAADAAASAFWDWSVTSFAQRCDHLEKMALALDENRAKFISLAKEEIGAAASWTNFNIDLSIEILQQAQTIGSSLECTHQVNPTTGVSYTIKRCAAGVVLGIAPWNAALVLATRSLAMPLSCGNTVVLKGSEHCPRTHEMLVQTFNDAGLPEGVLGYISNDGDIANLVVNTLIEHPAVRRINFTGSTRVGREVAVHAARNLKPCLLALSDKAPILILKDADIAAAVDATVHGAFVNQGQICMATERVIVVEEIADEFVTALVEKTAQFKAGDPASDETPLGRMVTSDAATRVKALIEDAVSKGGLLLQGGEVTNAVMQPAIVDRVSSAMRLYHEEVFGPVASILRVVDEEEAISIANDTPYGLTAAIFSNDTSRAHAIANRLETGMVQINGSTVFDDPSVPFGGMKESGYGRFGGAAAVDEFTELRWIAEHKPGCTPSI